MLPRLIGLTRVLLGVGVLLSPRRAAQIFALPAGEVNPSSTFVSRLTGNRELGIGAALALAPASEVRSWLRWSIVIDSADAVVSLLSMGAGLSRRAALLNAAATGGFAALELWALDRLTRQRSPSA